MADKTRKVKCSRCRKTSEVLESSIHDDRDTIWECTKQNKQGEYCHGKNVIKA